MKKRSYWVLFAVMVLVGAFLIVFLNSQNQLPMVPDVNAQQMGNLGSYVYNGSFNLGNVESYAYQYPSIPQGETIGKICGPPRTGMICGPCDTIGCGCPSISIINLNRSDGTCPV